MHKFLKSYIKCQEILEVLKVVIYTGRASNAFNLRGVSGFKLGVEIWVEFQHRD